MLRAVLVSLFFLAGCSTGGDVSNPISRKLNWFSYLEGDDLRAACQPGSPDRYRLVYNGNYEEQLRLYDLGEGGPGRFSQRVIGGGGIVSWTLNEPFAPWSGTTADTELTEAQAAAIVAALTEAGAFGPPAEGLELDSHGFFWTLAACHQGRYHFTAWRQPPEPAFVRPVLEVDRTGVAFNQPRPLPPRFRTTEPRLEFRLRVGANGLWGVP